MTTYTQHVLFNSKEYTPNNNQTHLPTCVAAYGNIHTASSDNYI